MSEVRHRKRMENKGLVIKIASKNERSFNEARQSLKNYDHKD